MPTADPRDFSTVLFLVLVAIAGYFLNQRVIGGFAFGWCIISAAAATILIRNVDNIESLLLRRGENQVLVEMKRIQKDVYAKVDELQRVAIGLARVGVQGIVSENRFVGADHQLEMLRKRDELDQFLVKTGIDAATRAEILKPVALWVDWDLRTAIVVNATAAWHPPPGTASTDSRQRDEITGHLRKILEQPNRLMAVNEAEQFLKTGGITSLILSQSIDKYRDFLTAGRLPQVGEADDLTKTP